jgi:hypothetical protein
MRSPFIFGPNQVAQNLVSGGVLLPGSTSGTTTITTPAVTTTNTLTLPGANPAVTGSVLTSDTSEVTSWTAQLPIANGGTGQATATAALNALLPSQANIDGYQPLVSNGTNTLWLNPFNETSIFDDFTWGNEQTNSPNGPFGLAMYGNAGGGNLSSTVVPVAVTAGRWGVMGYTTGTTSNATGLGGFFTDYGQYYCGQTQSLILTGSVNIPVLATVSVDYGLELGFRSNLITQAPTTNGIAIYYSRGSSTNWQGYTANNGTTTLVTSSTAVTTGWWNYKIVVTATTVDFYIALPGAAWTHIGQSTTNLPDSTHLTSMNTLIYKLSSSATASKFYVDWIKLDATFATAR